MINTSIQIAGVVLITAGIAMFSVPIAMIVAGAFTLAIGIARGLK
jgi:hypothetical protein